MNSRVRTDATLVAAALEGERQAFGEIVTRYQRLLCSLAYASLGNLSASEDVAQESFVDAWKQLATLQEPDKLKAWLCGILRHKVSRYRRSAARQPVAGADSLEEDAGFEAAGASIEQVVMQREEEALLWKAIETVPESYRETLVLYYREEQSIANVAREFDLSLVPDADKYQYIDESSGLVYQSVIRDWTGNIPAFIRSRA